MHRVFAYCAAAFVKPCVGVTAKKTEPGCNLPLQGKGTPCAEKRSTNAGVGAYFAEIEGNSRSPTIGKRVRALAAFCVNAVANIVTTRKDLQSHWQPPAAKGRADMSMRFTGRGDGRCRGSPKALDVEPAPAAPAAEAEAVGETRNSGCGSCRETDRADSSTQLPGSTFCRRRDLQSDSWCFFKAHVPHRRASKSCALKGADWCSNHCGQLYFIRFDFHAISIAQNVSADSPMRKGMFTWPSTHSTFCP